MKTFSICKLGAIIFLPLLASCVSVPKVVPTPDDPRYAPVFTPSQLPDRQFNGSLYNSNSVIDLYQRKAHKLGDILTIVLNEATSASKTSDTNITKSNATTVNDATALGSGFFGTGVNLSTNINSSVNFQGGANSGQSNRLTGSISVTVSRVLANGVLEVRGEKWMQLNQGSEYIRISGLVRKEDIAPDNSIVSTRLADVRITYSGTGALADGNEAGWITRFFTGKIWPL